MQLPAKMICEKTTKDLYAVLNISPLASPSDIPSAYRRAALLAHPDKGGSAEEFQLVTQAFEILSCASSRKLFDQAQGYRQNEDGGSGVWTSSTPMRARSNSGGHAAKRPAPKTSSPPPKKQRTSTCDVSKASGATKPECTKGTKRSQRTPEKALSTALDNLKNVLQAMCVEQRRQAITRMVFRVRTELLAFMEKQKKHAAQSNSSEAKVAKQQQAMLPIQDASDNKDTCSIDIATNMKQSGACQPGLRNRLSSSALPRFSCMNPCRQAPAADIRHFAQPRHLEIDQHKQHRAGGAMTGIQCKKSRYKAHLHIKSFRIYTNSHATIDMAIDHQIILMQIRLAWTAAWQANPALWEDRPEQFADLCTEVLKANGTSQSEMGLKAFVSMEARHWLGKNCFVISPVMGLSEALEWHAKLLRVRRISWPDFRAAWIELMQCKRHAQAKVRSATEAQAFADAAYKKHQVLLMQRITRDEAKSLARQQRLEKMKHRQQMERANRMQARAARHNAKIHVLLEKRLVKAIQGVERALDLKARSDARQKQSAKTRRKCSSVPQCAHSV
jgi:curved DNA-binding protein CbpA